MAGVLTIPDFLAVAARLAWDSAPNQAWQLADGVPQPMSPPSQSHALIQAEVAFQIRTHLTAANSPCLAAVTPGIIPRVQSDINLRVPD